ncbi:MAG: hypothetical protein EXS30_10040 [Pedosphaera sp.]|nr:hypothetical protein [Pedosphaera sp.]
MRTYQHKQRGTLIIVVLLATSLVLTIVGFYSDRRLLWVVPTLLLAGWLFNSLAIEITGGKLRWSFGPGLIRKRIALAEITSVKIVRTNVLEGWGIHLSRFGWLYNVSGFDAVAITLRSGKRFALGTDEPQVLAVELGKTIQKN